MKLKNIIFKKYLCCANLTLTTRLIAFVGITISAILASVLLHDTSKSDYKFSRKTALALGLDWQHFHPDANATHHADPEGRLISIIVTSYSVLYLMASLSLLCATVIYSRLLTAPWLLFETSGCLSKVGALVYHAINAEDRYNNLFITGSVIYIIITTWWCLVVFATQHSWSVSSG